MYTATKSDLHENKGTVREQLHSKQEIPLKD